MTLSEEAFVMETVLRAGGPVPSADLSTSVDAGLIKAGLLMEADETILPTPAAVHYFELVQFVQEA